MTTATNESPDHVTRTMLMRAPLARVWAALTDHATFGTWFRARLDRPFAVGATVTGNITHCGFEHVRFLAEVVAIDPPTRFAFRWHPYAVDPAVDYSTEPKTLVEFALSEEPGGTRVTVTESGFAQLPPGRRELAFRMNDEGWSGQLRNLVAHVEG
ncbi:MAG: SRPBCC family protein [Myxococcales bacterium]|nr:SRPBCC family protein [Myxococcales bacterium]